MCFRLRLRPSFCRTAVVVCKQTNSKQTASSSSAPQHRIRSAECSFNRYTITKTETNIRRNSSPCWRTLVEKNMSDALRLPTVIIFARTLVHMLVYLSKSQIALFGIKPTSNSFHQPLDTQPSPLLPYSTHVSSSLMSALLLSSISLLFRSSLKTYSFFLVCTNTWTDTVQRIFAKWLAPIVAHRITRGQSITNISRFWDSLCRGRIS